MPFNEIQFGKSSAEKESKELFDAVFIDGGYINEICKDSNFLVLGQKGSGKSAIGVKLDLLSNG